MSDPRYPNKANLRLPTAACALIIRNDVNDPSACIYPGTSRVLAVSRRDATSGNRWGLPGGKLDIRHDTLRNALPELVNTAIRETKEESGVVCEPTAAFFVALSKVTHGTHVVTTFLATYVSEDPSLKIEKDIEHRWLTWREFLSENAFPHYNSLMAEAWGVKYNSIAHNVEIDI